MPVQERLEQRAQYYRDTPPQKIIRDHIYGILLIPVALLGLWIRLLPTDNMEYMQALDSYYAARSVEAITRTGSLPPYDIGRYFPFGFPTHRENMGNLYIPAYVYEAVEPIYNSILTSLGAEELTFATFVQVSPAFFGAVMVVIMYFIGKELWNREAGLFAAFFLAASPAVLHRSSAGWFQKEAVAGPFMFASIYCLIRAWKGKSWGWGMLSGVALAISATSWGGTSYLFLLYPLVAFSVLFIDEDVERLLAAFTPTFLLGHVLAAVFNPGRNMIPNQYFIAALGVLGLIWLRYAVEQYSIIDDNALPYVTPAATVIGAVLAFLSPLYSQRLAGMVSSLISAARQSPGGSGVVGGTVAENQPAPAGEIVGQLGVMRSQNMDALQGFYPFAELFSGWTFAIVGTAAVITVMAYMLLKKYGVIEEVEPDKAYFGFAAVLLVFSGFMMFLLPGEGQEFLAFAFPLAIGLGGAFVLFFFAEREPLEMDIDNKWFLVIPLLWAVSTMYGVTQRSRLMFLASQPVALLAGIGLAVALGQLRSSTIWTEIADRSEELDARRVFGVFIAVLLVPVLVFNVGAAQAMAEGIGGQPNEFWMDNLEDIREETDPDDVLLSWWDYGYHFNSVAGRTANVDGGNLGHYRDATDGELLNLPIADFLAEDDHTEHMDFIEMLGADYVVLDSTMIGKFSAVSQIHHRDNTVFQGMQTADCVQENGQCVMQEANGQVYMIYGPIQLGAGAAGDILVPVQQDGQDLQPDGTPLIRLQGQQGGGQILEIENFCTPENGIVQVSEEDTDQDELADAAEQGEIPGCVAWHPPMTQDGQPVSMGYEQLVFIPEDVMDSTLVNLYLMNAHGMPEFDPADELSNGYVRVWEVDHDAAEPADG